jgi:hypothetical protein
VLISAAVVPGPPAFVAELMGSAASELDDLREAADVAVARVLSDLVTAGSQPSPPDVSSGGPRSPGSGSAVSDPGPSRAQGPGSFPAQLVVVGPGPSGEFEAAGPVSFAGFGRDVVVPALAEGAPSDRDLPTPIMVARYLASRDLPAHPDHAGLWASARWITTGGADATELGERLAVDAGGVGLILVADGAACHGPKAPRAQDARAQGYDDSVCAALASGQPGRLARIDQGLGDELGATGAQVWPVLVAAATSWRSADAAGLAGEDPVGEVLWAGAPYGVGWVVASWRRLTASAAATQG